MSALLPPAKRRRSGSRSLSPSPLPPSPSKRRRRSGSPAERPGSGVESDLEWNPNTLHEADTGFHPSLEEIAAQSSPIDFLCDRRLSWIDKQLNTEQTSGHRVLTKERKEELALEKPIWNLTQTLFSPSSTGDAQSNDLEQKRANLAKFEQWLEQTAQSEVRPLIRAEMEAMLVWERELPRIHERHNRGEAGDLEHQINVAEHRQKRDDHMWKLFMHSLHISDWGVMTRAASALKLHNLMSLLTTTRSYGHRRHGPRRGRSHSSVEGTDTDAGMSDEDGNVSVSSHSLASSLLSRSRKSPRFQKEPSVSVSRARGEPAGGSDANGDGDSSWWHNRDELVSGGGMPSFSSSRHSLKRALKSDMEKQKDFWQRDGTWQAIDKRVKHVYALLLGEFTTRDLSEYSFPTALAIFRTFHARHKSGSGLAFTSILDLTEAFIKHGYKSKAVPLYATKFDDAQKNLMPSPIEFELLGLHCALAKLEASADDDRDRERNVSSAFDWFMGAFTAGNLLERDPEDGKSLIGELEMHWCLVQVLSQVPAIRAILLDDQDRCMTFVARAAEIERDYREALRDADFTDMYPAKGVSVGSLRTSESTNLPTDFSRTKRAMSVLVHTNRWLYEDFEHVNNSRASEETKLREILADILKSLKGGPRQRLWHELEPLLEHWGVDREVLHEVQGDWYATIPEDYLSAACLYKRVKSAEVRERALEFVTRKVVPEMLTENNVYSWQYRNKRNELSYLDPLTAHHVEQLHQLHVERKSDHFRSAVNARQQRFITTRIGDDTRRCFRVTFDAEGGRLDDVSSNVSYAVIRSAGDMHLLRSLVDFPDDAKSALADAWKESGRPFLDLLDHDITPELLEKFRRSRFLASGVRAPVRGTGRHALQPGELCTRSCALVEDPEDASVWEHAPIMRKFLEVLSQRSRLRDASSRRSERRTDMKDLRFASLQAARTVSSGVAQFPPRVKLYE